MFNIILIILYYIFGYFLVESFKFGITDILNENLMPASIFLTQQKFPDETNIKVEFLENQTNANFEDAYLTMKFHRKMMNEFLCSKFVANQIINEINPQNMNLIRRIGKVEKVNEDFPVTNNKMKKSNENLFFNQSSSEYTNWLSKYATLDDIYHQFQSGSGQLNQTKNPKHISGSRRNQRRRYEVEEYDDENEEEGDITGYALHQPIPTQSPDIYFDSNNLNGLFHPTAGSKTGYNQHNQEQQAHYGVQHNAPSKELGIKDIMEIALSTLAFLSFGMFILQVLMCITMNKEENNLMMMTADPDGIGIGATEEIRRKRRSLSNNPIEKINEISKRVLISINTAILKEDQDGECLQKIICKNNNYARSQTDSKRIWMPVWGLGLTWLSAHINPIKTSGIMILKNLKAEIIGLGGGNCEKLYPNCVYGPLSSENRKK